MQKIADRLYQGGLSLAKTSIILLCPLITAQRMARPSRHSAWTMSWPAMIRSGGAAALSRAKGGPIALQQTIARSIMLLVRFQINIALLDLANLPGVRLFRQ